jgi:hypothetical protein
MSQSEIEKLNEKIPYEDGKIFWAHCKGYTSKVISNLLKTGWKATKSGAVYILRDKSGKEVLTAYSWEYLLFNAAMLIR